MIRLIDANALKKSFEKWWGCDDIPKTVVEDLIDNAPTVEPEKVKESELVKAYTKGFDAGVETVRPQGEWLDEKFVAFHLTCNQCGCNLRRQKNEVFEGDFDYNFCPNCGADMRGDNDDG